MKHSAQSKLGMKLVSFTLIRLTIGPDLTETVPVSKYSPGQSVLCPGYLKKQIKNFRIYSKSNSETSENGNTKTENNKEFFKKVDDNDKS